MDETPKTPIKKSNTESTVRIIPADLVASITPAESAGAHRRPYRRWVIYGYVEGVVQ